MPALFIRALPWVVGAFGLSKIDDVSDDLQKAAPWIAGAAVLYLIAKRGR